MYKLKNAHIWTQSFKHANSIIPKCIWLYTITHLYGCPRRCCYRHRRQLFAFHSIRIRFAIECSLQQSMIRTTLGYDNVYIKYDRPSFSKIAQLILRMNRGEKNSQLHRCLPQVVIYLFFALSFFPSFRRLCSAPDLNIVDAVVQLERLKLKAAFNLFAHFWMEHRCSVNSVLFYFQKMLTEHSSCVRSFSWVRANPIPFNILCSCIWFGCELMARCYKLTTRSFYQYSWSWVMNLVTAINIIFSNFQLTDGSLGVYRDFSPSLPHLSAGDTIGNR